MRIGFFIAIFLCVCTTLTTDFSGLLLSESIDVISVGESLKSSRDVAAARSSASLTKMLFTVSCDGRYIALFDVGQLRVGYISLQLQVLQDLLGNAHMVHQLLH